MKLTALKQKHIKTKTLFLRGTQEIRNTKVAKNLWQGYGSGLEVLDKKKYSGNMTEEDEDCIHMRRGDTGGNNQGSGETSDR